MNLQALQTLGQRVLSSTRDRIATWRKEIGSVWSEGAAADAKGVAEHQDADEEVKEHLTEWSISSYLLRISAASVALRALHYFVKREWLLALITIISSIFTAPQWIWSAVINMSWDLTPIACGAAMTVVTWYTVFLDRCIPGVYPQLVMSERKQWFPFSSSSFHLGYIMAIVNGLILSTIIYLGYNNSASV